MPVKIRLQRHGKKGRPFFHIVVADSRAPRDGRFIERIGAYNPITDPATIELNTERAADWMMKGAQPSETAKAILSYKGVMYRVHLNKGVEKGAITQEQADAKFGTWNEQKSGKIEAKKTRLSTESSEAMKARLAQEAKVNEARIENQKKREAELHLAASAAEAPAEEAPATENTDAPEAAPEA